MIDSSSIWEEYDDGSNSSGFRFRSSAFLDSLFFGDNKMKNFVRNGKLVLVPHKCRV